MESFSGKTAFITGGAGGLGFAIARRCIREGMNVVIADIEEAELRKAEAQLRALDGEVLAVVCDVADESSVTNARDQAVAAYARIDVLFNNAGVSAGTFLWETTRKDWDWIIGVNVYGLINALRAFVPVMLGQGSAGHVVNTASIAGLLTAPGTGAYSMTKSAIISISETLLDELRMIKADIGVTVICPGFIKTRLFESERNRPACMANGEVSEAYRNQRAALQAFLQPAVQNGVEPDIVVDEVFQAMRDNRLYGALPKEVTELYRQKTRRILNEQPE